MSWHYLQGQEEASWEGSSLDGAPSALLKLIPTTKAYCLQDSETESSTHSQSGTMLQHLTGSRGGEASMSSAVDSLARTSVSPTETLKALRESAVDYGEKCAASFAKLDLDSLLWKTVQCLLFGGLELFSGTWPYRGTMRLGTAYAVPMSAGITNGTESGLLPTPRDSMGKPCSKRIGPDSDEYRHNLEEFLGGKPNPMFAEWMMGWPIGWTNVTTELETARFRQWFDLQSEPSREDLA